MVNDGHDYYSNNVNFFCIFASFYVPFFYISFMYVAASLILKPTCSQTLHGTDGVTSSNFVDAPALSLAAFLDAFRARSARYRHSCLIKTPYYLDARA